MSNETKWWLIGSGGLIILGSFMPWISAGLISLAGTSGDGQITAVLGGLIVLAGLIGKVSRLTGMAAIGFSVISLLIVGNVFTNLSDGGSVENMGFGLVVVGAASIAAVAAGAKVMTEAARSRSMSAQETQQGRHSQ